MRSAGCDGRAAFISPIPSRSGRDGRDAKSLASVAHYATMAYRRRVVGAPRLGFICAAREGGDAACCVYRAYYAALCYALLGFGAVAAASDAALAMIRIAAKRIRLFFPECWRCGTRCADFDTLTRRGARREHFAAASEALRRFVNALFRLRPEDAFFFHLRFFTLRATRRGGYCREAARSAYMTFPASDAEGGFDDFADARLATPLLHDQYSGYVASADYTRAARSFRYAAAATRHFGLGTSRRCRVSCLAILAQLASELARDRAAL